MENIESPLFGVFRLQKPLNDLSLYKSFQNSCPAGASIRRLKKGVKGNEVKEDEIEKNIIRKNGFQP
ncbi:MAG: hypothetical protein R6U32_07615 [Candidatus Woesearchaeota archaeon]